MTDPALPLLAGLDPDATEHVERRLRANVMAWLTTVRPSGRPDTVPVWFLWRDDGRVLLYSQPNAPKLRNIATNPHVALGLDVTDLGRDIVRLEGTAAIDPQTPPADQVPAYRDKYAERIAAMFGTPADFASAFSTAIVITPTRLRT